MGSKKTKLGRVALIEEKWFEVMPDLRMSPMLAKDVGWVKDTINMVHGNELCSNCFANTVEG